MKLQILLSATFAYAAKILCLHGGGMDSGGMRSLMGDFESALPEFEFVYAQTPEAGGVWIVDPPSKDEPTTDPHWADNSFNYLDNLIESQGPFYALCGYSQGSAIIPVYLAHRGGGSGNTSSTGSDFNRVILFNGYLPTTHLGLIDLLNSAAPLTTPAFVFSGGKDFFGPYAPEQAAKFSNVIHRESANVGHEPPPPSDPNFQQILDFIRNRTSSIVPDKTSSATTQTCISLWFMLSILPFYF